MKSVNIFVYCVKIIEIPHIERPVQHVTSRTHNDLDTFRERSWRRIKMLTTTIHTAHDRNQSDSVRRVNIGPLLYFYLIKDNSVIKMLTFLLNHPLQL